MDNPFFESWSAPFEAPPLDRIMARHFPPAFEQGLAEHRAEIERLKQNSEKPDFRNTIEALELSGQLLRRVSRIFGNLTSADTTSELQAIEREMAPALAAHWSSVFTDPVLFRKVDAVLKDGAQQPDAEQRRVLDLTHRRFVRAGARLDAAERERASEIDQRLASLGTQFSQNVLRDESDYLLVLQSEEDLAGLPEAARAASARLAEERGHPGQYAVSLSRSSVEPFLSHADRRDIRETLFSSWVRRGESGGETDNREIVAETLRLRDERARLLGYANYAAFKLEETMAGEPAAVRNLLETVWTAGRRRALNERDKMQRLISEEGANFALAPHDWRYYAEKVRRAEFDLDESELRAYLPLDAVIAAAFDVAGRLFGLQFGERFDIPLYHPDVRAFEVKDSSGGHVALFYADYFARPSKRSGAWMSAFRGQRRLGGSVRPIIVNVMNFVKGGDGRPCLLGIDEARTLFHEFGHALHGMLSDVTYPSIAGTSVPTDFVELPSQLYEHWLMRPEVLRRFARHYATGAPIPEDVLRKALASSTFNQGFATVEYCASALVDLDLHEGGARPAADPMAAQRATLERIGMLPEIEMRHRTPHFSHIFSGDHYAAGYYSYLWSEVLDADAFDAFAETGDVFNPSVAAKLREFVLSAGDKRDPKAAYAAFRGRLPDVGPLLKKRGLAAPIDAPAN